MHAIEVREFGGPEVLELVEIAPPIPAAGQLLVDVELAGVNFMDLNHRAGARGGRLPFVPGAEGAGHVRALGDGVTGFAVGDRVMWKSAPASYAEQVVVDASELLAIPPGISLETAAALLLQGITAEYLSSSTYPIGSGDLALVHAAAGGVGLLLTQLITLRGGRVIGTTSSDDKVRLAKAAGAEHVIRYDQVDFAPIVRQISGDHGVPVVYDAIGKTTFEASLACLGPRGHLVLYGAASGAIPPFDLARLVPQSLYVSRPSSPSYTRTRAELEGRVEHIFSLAAAGQLEVRIGGRFPLGDAELAHRALSSRTTSGKLLLTVRDRDELATDQSA